MAGLEILHHVACLQRSGLGDRAGEEVDGYGVGGVGWGDEGEDKLCDLADAGNGVEICFTEGADAHDGEKESEEDREESGREGD